MSNSSSEPVSWLRLELYHLGELAEPEARAVEQAVACDAATEACLELIRKPAKRLLPAAEPRAGRSLAARTARWAAPIAALAAAAAVALFVGSREQSEPETLDLSHIPARARIKGGEVAIELVRERAGNVTLAPSSFSPGDRFKLLISCPPSLDAQFEIAVFQDSDVSFPLEAAQSLECGNQVALPGAFTLSGPGTATICAIWGKPPPPRAALRVKDEGLRGASACVGLRSESGRD